MNEFTFINVVSLIVEQDSMLPLYETVPDLVVSPEGQEVLRIRVGGL